MRKVILILICFSFLIWPGWSQSGPWDREFTREVNLARWMYGSPEVTFDQRLKLLAIYYSDICAEKGDIKHDYVPDELFSAKMTELDIHGKITELLALSPKPSPEIKTVISALLLSPEHKAGLLDPDKYFYAAAKTVRGGKTYITIYLF